MQYYEWIQREDERKQKIQKPLALQDILEIGYFLSTLQREDPAFHRTLDKRRGPAILGYWLLGGIGAPGECLKLLIQRLTKILPPSAGTLYNRKFPFTTENTSSFKTSLTS